MENEKSETIILRPEGVEGGVWASILLAAFLLIIFIKTPAYSSFKALPVFLILFSPLYIFLVVHIFENYRIIIRESKISFPKTDTNGFLLFFALGRLTIDISSIRRIIKYPSLFDGNRMGESYPGECQKISITYLNAKQGIYLAYSFWGSELIEELINEILERNENVQIIDYNHLIEK
ncbi:MAG: hypothetical protein NTY14_06500 [Candidatus Omnitrophica bacterium]|nr:hypothetical protein [Candidatus Omnitrophota bacterium]